MTTASPEPPPTAPTVRPHRRFRQETRSGRRAALPGGLLGMLALVAAVETAVSAAGARFLDPPSFCWAFTAEAARTRGPGADVLVIGDSLAKHGLIPRVIASATGKTTVNLAVAAAPAPATDCVLRRALDAGARPEAIVLELKPGLLVGGPRFAVRYWPLLLPPLDAARLALAYHNAGFAGELLVEYLLPSFRSRHEIRGDLRAALQGTTGPLRGLNALGRRQWTVNAGANLGTPRPDYAGTLSEAEREEFLADRFHVHRVNARYARALVARALATGARVYLVVPPEIPALEARRAVSGSGGKFDAFLRGLQGRYPALTVLDARGAGYPAGAFVDPVHLAANGALALSEDVAAVLRADLERPASKPSQRWVRLPFYRARPLPADLEHVEISRARLNEATGR